LLLQSRLPLVKLLHLPVWSSVSISVGFDLSEVFVCRRIGADSEVVVLSANTNPSIRFLFLRCRLLDFRALRLRLLLVLLFAFVKLPHLSV
jgi:hypothetical protein